MFPLPVAGVASSSGGKPTQPTSFSSTLGRQNISSLLDDNSKPTKDDLVEKLQRRLLVQRAAETAKLSFVKKSKPVDSSPEEEEEEEEDDDISIVEEKKVSSSPGGPPFGSKLNLLLSQPHMSGSTVKVQDKTPTYPNPPSIFSPQGVPPASQTLPPSTMAASGSPAPLPGSVGDEKKGSEKNMQSYGRWMNQHQQQQLLRTQSSSVGVDHQESSNSNISSPSLGEDVDRFGGLSSGQDASNLTAPPLSSAQGSKMGVAALRPGALSGASSVAGMSPSSVSGSRMSTIDQEVENMMGLESSDSDDLSTPPHPPPHGLDPDDLMDDSLSQDDDSDFTSSVSNSNAPAVRSLKNTSNALLGDEMESSMKTSRGSNGPPGGNSAAAAPGMDQQSNFESNASSRGNGFSVGSRALEKGSSSATHQASAGNYISRMSTLPGTTSYAGPPQVTSFSVGGSAPSTTSYSGRSSASVGALPSNVGSRGPVPATTRYSGSMGVLPSTTSYSGVGAQPSTTSYSGVGALPPTTSYSGDSTVPTTTSYSGGASAQPSITSSAVAQPPTTSYSGVGALPPTTSYSGVGALPPTTSYSGVGALPPTTSYSGAGALPPTTSYSGASSLPTTTSYKGISGLPPTTNYSGSAALPSTTAYSGGMASLPSTTSYSGSMGRLPPPTTTSFSGIGALPSATSYSSMSALPPTTSYGGMGGLPSTTSYNIMGGLPSTTSYSGGMGAMPTTTSFSNMGALPTASSYSAGLKSLPQSSSYGNMSKNFPPTSSYGSGGHLPPSTSYGGVGSLPPSTSYGGGLGGGSLPPPPPPPSSGGFGGVGGLPPSTSFGGSSMSEFPSMNFSGSSGAGFDSDSQSGDSFMAQQISGVQKAIAKQTSSDSEDFVASLTEGTLGGGSSSNNQRQPTNRSPVNFGNWAQQESKIKTMFPDFTQPSSQLQKMESYQRQIQQQQPKQQQQGPGEKSVAPQQQTPQQTYGTKDTQLPGFPSQSKQQQQLPPQQSYQQSNQQPSYQQQTQPPPSLHSHLQQQQSYQQNPHHPQLQQQQQQQQPPHHSFPYSMSPNLGSLPSNTTSASSGQPYSLQQQQQHSAGMQGMFQPYMPYHYGMPQQQPPQQHPYLPSANKNSVHSPYMGYPMGMGAGMGMGAAMPFSHPSHNKRALDAQQGMSSATSQQKEDSR